MRRHEWTGLLAGTLALCLGTAIACGTDDEAAKEGGCSYSYECDVGQICKAGACVSAAPLEEGRGGSGGTGGTGGGTGGSGGTTGVGGSGGVGGAGGTSAERPTFAPDGFRRCFDSLECAVFGGDCVVELTLSRPLADGSERIALADLDPSLAPGQGLCAVACTNEPRVCDSVVISGPDGESAPSTCQLVFAGESPYPADAPPFPFDRLLDPAALERGVPFAAICRPPFQFAKRHSPSFCQACAVAGDCGPGDACWLEGAYAAPPFGSCVQACTEAKDCPFGFTCTDVGAESVLLAGRPGRYCIPFEDTCGRCLDMDGNQRGVGTCGPVDEPNTAVDCDDSNAAAYFDAVNPAHAFPAFCGEHDFNCNGVSDRAEQLGTPAHCAECGDVCAGRVANGDRACQPVEGTGGFACVAVCAAGYADCNGEVADGCEAELQPHMVWARDADGDGRGSRLKLRYFCAGAAEPGWVQNMLDCNDEAAHVYGGGLDTAGASVGAAPELCDGVDNDCNNRVDDATVVVEGGVVIAAAGDDCASGHAGVCAAGTLVCAGAGTTAAAMTCVPDLDPAVRATVAESCNGLDDDCDGTVDEEVDWFRDMGVANPGNAPATCAIPGGVGVCAQGVYGCLADGEGGAAWSCIGNQPSATDAIGDGVDSNCDGVDGDLSAAIFVRRNVSGGELEGNDLNDGSAQRPVATLQRALDLACAGGIHPCRDVYLESFSFVSAQPVRIPLYAGSSVDAHVRIYGGFQPTPVGCDAPSGCTLQWTRADRRTTLVRKAPARIAGASPFGSIYAALQSASGTGSVSLLVDQVDVEVESPDLADVLTAGQHAPTQVGLHCMAGGCSHLELTNVTITVQDAIDGGAGTEGAMAEVLTADANGRDADQHGNTTDTGIHSPAAGGTASACAGGVRPHGGSAGGYRIDNGGGSRIYAFIGTGGSGSSGGAAGCRAWRRSGECSANTRESVCGTTAQPGRGGNGARGSGGSWSGTRQLRLQLAGGVLAPSDGVSVSAPSRGGYGSGGGGGAGCMSHGGCVGSAPFYCQHANAQGVDVYGSGGGAGGCGGESGQNGGNGGNSVGMILTPPASGDLRFVVDDARPFLLLVGNAGKGGNGGNGGKGAGGGWAGSLNSGVGWINSNAGYYVGGNGGDGAGGGGGAGGLGGFSIGFWQHCTRTGGGATGTCGVELPGRVRAQPYDYVQVGSGGAGGAKGRGGAAGAKTPAQGKSDAGAGNNGGTDGQDGIGGVAHALYRS